MFKSSIKDNTTVKTKDEKTTTRALNNGLYNSKNNYNYISDIPNTLNRFSNTNSLSQFSKTNNDNSKPASYFRNLSSNSLTNVERRLSVSSNQSDIKPHKSTWKNTIYDTNQKKSNTILENKTLYNSSSFRFPIMIIDKDYIVDDPKGSIQSISSAIENEGWEVVVTNSYNEFINFAQEQSRAAAFILRITHIDNGVQEFISSIRKRNRDVPIYLYIDNTTPIKLSIDITKSIKGIMFASEDTPDSIARNILRDANKYLENIKPSFFEALLEYAEDGSYSWHCPGHSGGVAFLKSPVGQMFHQYFGENMLRADVCNAVEELGQLLDHNGSIGESEKNAGRVFGSDYCFFVTNGGSMSNRVVWHHTVAKGDVVLVDRNCHVSVVHCLVMTGCVPIFLGGGGGNHLGMCTPIPREQITRQNIEKLIKDHPLLQGREMMRPRLLMVTQSTQDGLLYNIDDIKEAMDGYVENLHFDETWVPHAAFHPFYANYHSMDLQRQRNTQSSMVYTTQAIHKVLAATSQASYILVRDSNTTKLDTELFNESYLMHCSTSPQYSIIASCDVTAAMMEPPQGTALVEQSISEAIHFRRAMSALTSQQDWWFEVWEPDYQEHMSSQEWVLQSQSTKPQSYSTPWHAHTNITSNFYLLDPIKVTILSPGLSPSTQYLPHGIPAIVLSKYLSEHGINVVTTGFYSIILLFTIGMTKGRWNTIISILQQFKSDYDSNRPLWRIMPKTTSKHSAYYANKTLKDICNIIHEYYTKHDIIHKLNMLNHYPEPALLPSKAFEQIARRNTQRVHISDLIGRIAVSTIVAYPPGMPLIIPGETFNHNIVTFLQLLLRMKQLCPGFECCVDGIGYDKNSIGFFVDCVKEKNEVRYRIESIDVYGRFL